jgi:hypothetical protein
MNQLSQCSRKAELELLMLRGWDWPEIRALSAMSDAPLPVARLEKKLRAGELG